MKQFAYIALAALLCLSCHEKRERTDQGKTSACWIYALCTCIEHEAANRGDDVHLSRTWLMYNELKEQTVTRYLYNSQNAIHPTFADRHDAEGSGASISLRNVGPEVLYLIRHYGLIPDQNDKTQIDNSNVLERKLTILADQATSMQELQQGMHTLLPRFTIADHPYDEASAVTPRVRASAAPTFYYLAARYNPFQFAESVMYYQHWRFYAPSPYHPHGEPFALEVPDNRRYHEYINLSMQELLPMVIRSLHQGHYVYWEFGKPIKDPSTKQGATAPSTKQGATAHSTKQGTTVHSTKQLTTGLSTKQLTTGLSSSDHAMAIIGIARNGDFICQNSYGTHWGKHGTCLVKQKDFMSHTCNVGIIE